MSRNFILNVFLSSVLFFSCLLSGFSQAQGFFKPSEVFRGEILDKKDKKLLYKYTRTEKSEGPLIVVKRQYDTPEGQLAALETITYDQSGKVVKMELDQTQMNAKGSFELKDGTVIFTYTQDGKTKTSEEKLTSDFVSQDQIVEHVYKNWEAIMKGETVNIRLPVIFRRETVGFKLFKEKETDDGVVIKLKPSSFVIAALVDPVLMVMKKDGDHRTVFVDGRVTPKIQKDGKWKDLDALLVLKY